MRLIHLALAVAICMPLSALAQDHEHSGIPPEKLGAVRFANTCSAEVQPTFTRAVALLHSFWYEEANRQFRAVADKDPGCGIASWGAAMTNWHPLWEPRGPNPGALQQGAEAIAKAKAAGAKSEREKAYIAALDKFYTDSDKTEHLTRVLAYEKAMEELQLRYADDTEGSVFYALALLGSATASPPDKTYARQRKAAELLRPIFRAQPEHPGVAHYIIHACDYPTLASEGLDAARRYAQIAPDAPHALHMPSHVFTRLGLWQESIQSNLASATAARKHGLQGDELHALDYLEFAYLQTGQDALAGQIVSQLPQVREGDSARFAGLYALAAIPARYAIERRQWAAAAALPPANMQHGRYSWAPAAIYFARALGAARSGKLEQARSDLAEMAKLHQDLVDSGESYWATQVEIQRRAASAWLSLGAGKADEALASMRSAVELEDTTDKHPVTPGAIAPARLLLGDMLIELKKGEAALGEFERLLSVEPNRFAAVYGAARAASLEGDRKKAAAMYERLLQLAPGSDSPRAELREARAFLATSASAR